MASDPAEPAGDETKAKIFISYSRKDMGFVDRLEAALKARGVEPLIDRTEIYAFEDWWKRIEALVSQADTIVFVLSPDSVSSEVALREVAFATSLNKRFAPIVVRRVDVNTVPEALRKLNFIFFDFDTQFEGSADRLAEALRTDIGWIRKHTEFVESARRWAVAGRPGPRGLLLRPPVLEEAERWIASRPEGAPSATEEAQAFIAESRTAATQRRNILSGSLAAGLLVALGLAGLAYWQRGIAVEQRDKALVTQSRFLADLSRQLAERGDQVSAALLGMEALPDPKSTVFRPLVPQAQDALYQSLSTLRELAVLSAPGTKIAAASASDDGSRIMTMQEDRTVRVWDAKTNLLLATHGPFLADMVNALLTRSGDRILIIRSDKSIEPIDALTGARRKLLPFERITLAGYFNGTIRAMSSDHRHAVLNPLAAAEIDPDTGSPRSIMPLDGAATEQGGEFRISDNGATVVSNTGTIWDAKTGKVIATIDPGADRFLDHVNLSPDGTRVVWQN
jgi:hypothetical protein